MQPTLLLTVVVCAGCIAHCCLAQDSASALQAARQKLRMIQPSRHSQTNDLRWPEMLSPLFAYKLRSTPGETGQLETTVEWADSNAVSKLRSLNVSILLKPDTAMPRVDGFLRRGRVNLREWQKAMALGGSEQSPAKGVLLGLAPLTNIVTMLSQAARAAPPGPAAPFPVHWEEGPEAVVAHLPLIRDSAIVLTVQAAAKLELNRPHEALADVASALFVSRLLQSSLDPMSHHCRCNAFSASLQGVWEGLRRRSWTTNELLSLRSELNRHSFLDTHNDTLLFVLRTIHPAVMNQMRREGISPDQPPELSGLTNFVINSSIASGGARLRIDCDRLEADILLSMLTNSFQSVDAKAGRVYPAEARISAVVAFYYDYSFARRLGNCQSLKQVAYLACLLEEHYAATRQYPAALHEIITTPEHARNTIDPYTGKEFEYRRTADGRYELLGCWWGVAETPGETKPEVALSVLWSYR